MYKLQEKPDKEACLENGSTVRPLATLKDEYGGISHIILDDHCYVLINLHHDQNPPPKNRNTGKEFTMVRHWYREAVEAIKILPLPD